MALSPWVAEMFGPDPAGGPVSPETPTVGGVSPWVAEAFGGTAAPPPPTAAPPLPSDIVAAPPPIPGTDYNTAGSPEPGAWDLYGKPLIHTAAKAASLASQGLGALARLGVEAVRGTPPEQSLVQPDLEHADEPAAFTSPGIGNVAMREGFARPAAAMGEDLAALDRGDYRRAADLGLMAAIPGLSTLAGPEIPVKPEDPSQDVAVPAALRLAEPIAYGLGSLGAELPLVGGIFGAIGSKIPWVERAMAVGFTPEMLNAAYEGSVQAKDMAAKYGWLDPRTAEAVMGAVTSGAFGLLGLKHAAGPLRPPALTDVYRGKVPKATVLGGAEDRTIPPPPIDPETGLPDVAPPQATPAEPGPSWFNRLLGRVPAPPVAPEQPPQTWSAEVPRSGMPSDILRSPQEVMLDQLEASGRPNDPGQQLGEFVPAPIEASVGAWPEVPAGGPVDVSAAVKPEVRPAPAPAPAPAPEPISPESALSEVDARQAILDQLKLQGAPDVATDEMAAKYEAQRKQQADAEEAAAITASEEVKAQELQRSIEEALQKPPAEPRLAGDLARRAREEAARIRPRVGQMPTDQLRKAEAYYRSEGLIEPGDIAREELARREPGGPQYVAPGTEAKRPEPTQDLGIAADTGPSPLGPGEYQGEEPIPGYDKPLPPPATDLGSRTAEAEGRTTKVGDHYTIADAHGTGPTVEAIAPRLERYARSIGEIINGIGKSLGMRPIFRGLSTEYDFNAVRLPDGTIRLSPATILDAAKARAGNLGLEPGTPEYDAKVRRETARLSTHEAAHEIGHLAIEQEAARDPVLAAKLKEAPGSVEQLPEGLRYVSEEAAARAAEKLGEGPHGRAFRSALAKILAKNRRSLHTAVGRLEASLAGDTELALQHLREAVDGSWEEHKASGGRGSDVGPDSGLLQSARREVGDEAEARARRERQGHADRLPVGGAGVGTRPGEAVPARPGERRAEPGAGTAVRGGEPERPGRVIPPVFDDNRGDYQLSVVDNARALVEAARKFGRDVVRTSSGVDIADGFTPGSKVISYVDRNGVAQAGALLHADGRISDLAQMRIGSPDVFRVLHAAAEAGGRLSPDISLSADSTRLIENIANRLGLDAKDIRSGKIALGDIIRLRGERAKRRFGPGLAERPVAGGAGEGVQRPGGAGADSAPRAEPKAEPALSRRREDRPASEPDAGVAAPPEPEFSRRREEPKSEPLAEDDYAGKYLARVITPAAAAKNLTTHLAAQSGESNVSMIRDPINSRYGGIRDDKPFVVGPVTPEQWLARARAWIPDQKEWSAARDWYRQLRGRFEEVFGEGPEAMKNLIAWAQSQQNESPSGGMRNVRRAADLASGIDLRFPPGHKKAGQPMLAGMAHDKLIAAMLDAAKETGTAAKLSDFLDATFDRATRSWVGNDPRGGVPTPIDVWAGRDRGFVDEQMIGYARKAGMKWANKLSVDGAVSAPGRYESGIKFYREIADYLNENNVDGGKWTSTEAQAVGWTAMRRMAGIPDEGPRDIISKNARNLAFEAGAYGKGSEYAERFAGLTPEQQDRMNAIVGPRLIGEAASRSGVRVIQTTRGVGGYKEDSNANWDVRVFGSPEQVEDFARFLGLGAQQDSVVATRRMKSGKDPGWDFRFEQRPSGKALRSWWKMAQTKDPVFARGGFTVLSTPDGHLLRLFPGRPEDGRAFNRYLSHSGRMLDFAEIMGREFGVESIEQEPIRADNMWVGNDWSEGNGGKGYSDALKARGRRLDGFDDVARSIFDDAHATVTAEPGAVAEPVAQELPAYSRRREDVAARESYKPPTKEEAESIGTRPETDELRKRREEVGRDQTDRWLDARGPIKRDEYRYSRRREDVLPADSPERDIRYSKRREDEKPAPTFYSQLSRVAEKLPQAMSGRDMMRYLTDPKRSPGVRILDEAKWTGLDDFLTKNSDRKITPAEVQQYLRENEVKVEEVTLGSKTQNWEVFNNKIGNVVARHPTEAAARADVAERGIDFDYDTSEVGPSGTKFSDPRYQTPGGPLSRDTEILTEVGWKRMDVVQVGDVVLTRADAGGALTWESVEAVPTIHAAKLYHFKNQSVDMMVTADHQMVVKRRRTSAGLVRMRAEDLWVASECLIPLVGSPVPGGPGLLFGLPAEDVAEFIGWYIAEGSCPVRRGKKTTPSISQSREANPEKCARLEALLGRLGISWKYHDSGPSYTIHIRSMPKALVRVLHAQGTSREKRVPVALFHQPAVVISRFLDGLLLGDGSLARGEGRKPRWTLYTLSAQVADATQALAVLIGQHARIGRRPNGLWTVGFNCKQGASVDDAKAGLVEYNDTAFCVTVKNHAIYVRRNGIAAFTGNSNYRELLLTLPTKPIVFDPTGWTAKTIKENKATGQRDVEVYNRAGEWQGTRAGFRGTDEEAIRGAAKSLGEWETKDAGFRAGHFDELNVLAHVRFNKRVDADGRKTLFLEELQGDWPQKFRRAKEQIKRAVTDDWNGTIKRMKDSGALKVECD